MCPDENALTQFARGAATDLHSMEAHLDGCEKCRRAVAAAASEQTLPREKPAQELSAGARVDRYELERELGRGGMGTVYQARDLTLDRRVALKLLHAKRDEAAQARLVREAKVMAKLSHPNVVPVFELGQWNDDLYLAMELITGVTLEAWLKRAKHRSSEIIERFVQAGRGLSAAHAAGVVHRDFKPANVLVGLDDRVRVTDFGLSRPAPKLELPADNAVVTRTGAIIGTLAYMSPEQLVGKVADERSDQFSFCVSLVEALSGERPFAGDTVFELAQSLKEKPRLGAGISTRLRAVLRKGLELEPADRYASMTALLNAIERTQRRSSWPIAFTGVAAALALGIFAAQRVRHAPPSVIQLQPELVSVVTAADDLPEGTVISKQMLQQKEMPKDYATASVVTPERKKEIVGQVLRSRVRKGDPLLWTQFNTTTWVVAFRRDVPAGATLSRKDLEERQVPGELSGGDVVQSKDFWSTFGRKSLAAHQQGEILRVSMLEDPNAKPKPPVEPTLTDAELADYVFDLHRDTELAKCSRLAWTKRLIRMKWSVSPEGVPYDVETLDWFRDDEPAVRCLIETISKWRFPARSQPTHTTDWTFNLAAFE